MQWALGVREWEGLHDNPCKANHKHGMPKTLRGAVLSEALIRPAQTTVNNSFSPELLNSEQGVDAIPDILVQFNPITYAKEVSAALKKLAVTTRREFES